MKIKSRIFTDKESQYILDNFESMTYKEIAAELGKPYKKVVSFCNLRGLKKSKTVYFTQHESEYVSKNYNKKETREIATTLKKTVKQVSDHAYRLGISRDLVRFDKNEDYFKVIDTEDKAYWLGFLYADGCINQSRNKNTGNIKNQNLEVSLASVDHFHLEKLKMSIGYTGEIKTKIVKLNGKEYPCSRLTVSGIKFTDHLINKGCTPRKSLTLTFPGENILPKELQNHFIRGYFDGDGCVFYSHNEEYKQNTYTVNFVGTLELLSEIQIVFESEAGLNRTKIIKKGNAYQMSYGGFHNFNKIKSYLYSNSMTFLDRKFKKFIEANETKIYKDERLASQHRNMLKKIG